MAGRYRLLHLATHGQANDELGDYSFLAFGGDRDSVQNEFLYVRDLYDLSLLADLVVLSACETGTGEWQRGEGIISLARAFAYAGARSIVTTLWSVNDRRSKELMIAFYGGLGKGMTREEALWRAKYEMLESDASAHPFFWAGYILIGEDGAW